MKLLSVSLTLCAMLTLSRAVPIDASPTVPVPVRPRQTGFCEFIRDSTARLPGAYIPQCDMNGNFLPQQCHSSTGYCWCVDILNGKEIPNTRTPPGVTPVNCKGEFLCPIGWTHFAGKCFIFFNTPKTWIEAEAYCLFELANLASIHSYEENYFIQALTKSGTNFPETWIGGTNAVHPPFWMWTDGSRFTYENWFEEPNPKRPEHCLKINFGLEWNWNQAACNETHPFVCSKRI